MTTDANDAGESTSDERETDRSSEETVGPELTQEDLDRAGEKMDGLTERYRTGARETVTLPGTGGTVSGTAFADYVAEHEAAEQDGEGQPT